MRSSTVAPPQVVAKRHKLLADQVLLIKQAHARVCFGKHHLNHIQGHLEERPIAVHLLQQLQLSSRHELLQCNRYRSVCLQ